MEKKIIYLSPSAQEANIGVGNYGTEEYRMNRIADVLQNALIRSGRYIVYRNNPAMTLDEIIQDSNSVRPDAHIAIHSNAGGGTGPEIFIYSAGTLDEILARAIYDELIRVYYNKSGGRGIKVDYRLKETREVQAPAVIIEVAFHDNVKDAAWIINNTPTIAMAIKAGIDSYFNKTTK